MTRLIVDSNSVLNAALLGGKDELEGRQVITEEGKKVWVNSALYGVDKYMERIASELEQFDLAPRNMLVVWDGRNAKAHRQRILPEYKVGRTKIDEINIELNKAREMVTQRLLDLGATIIQQDGAEADDVIAYLCKELRSEPNVIVTSDGDLTVLCDENTHVWRLGKLDENPYGAFPHRFITLYKALVGDPSDKIPGAKGFGDAAWLSLVRTFGLEGLQLLEGLFFPSPEKADSQPNSHQLERLAEDVADLPILQKVLDNVDMVYKSWRCARLDTSYINTMSRPMTIQAGMVKQWVNGADQYRDLKPFYGTCTLVTADNYEAVKRRFQEVVETSPFVALDIETSSSEQSDEWLEALAAATGNTRERVDVLGHELTGMSLTFGNNTQHTIYMSVDHADTNNITVDQCREMVECIPHQKVHTVIQNRNFEFSVLYRTWGDKWKDNGWHGFVPNAIDSKVAASYTDENLKKGLKERSKAHLGYEQATYEQTTRREGPKGSLTGGRIVKEFSKVVIPAVVEDVTEEQVDLDSGNLVSVLVGQRVVEPAVIETWELREYKMNQLTAKDVFSYGCDDTICTAALQTYYKFVMDLEHTWDVYLKVETLPEYLTSLAFVQGIPIDMRRLIDLEKADDASYDKAWATLSAYLIAKGWEGTTCPQFEGSLEPADVKLAASALLGEFSTRKRKANAMAADIREQYPDNDVAEVLAVCVERGDVEGLNRHIKLHFTGEPKVNFGSPKQMQNLFYNVIGIPPRIVNKPTENQRADPVMASAFKKWRKQKDGRPVEYTPDERNALISKASTDDSAVDTALALDKLDEPVREVLKAYKVIKEVQTRRNLFYKTYKAIPHWRDGRVHPSLNQAEAVTRRWSSSNPNIQQAPKGSDGLRTVMLPHHNDAVVISMDFSSQEIRLLCDYCKDENLTACYIGDNLKDVHSLTAVSAAIYLWGREIEYDDFIHQLESEDAEEKKRAKALRAQAKTVVFSSQYDCQAPNLAQQLMVSEDIAQQFLDAKEAAFPKVEPWKESVRQQVQNLGYATTKLGARRHLARSINSDDKWEASKAERQGPNFAIQGSGREQVALAMASMWNRGIFHGRYDAVPYAPIHDEFVASVHRKDVLEFAKEMHACMVQPYADMHIPIVSSISFGRNFGDQIELGTSVDPETFQKALNKLFGEGS